MRKTGKNREPPSVNPCETPRNAQKLSINLWSLWNTLKTSSLPKNNSVSKTIHVKQCNIFRKIENRFVEKKQKQNTILEEPICSFLSGRPLEPFRTNGHPFNNFWKSTISKTLWNPPNFKTNWNLLCTVTELASWWIRRKWSKADWQSSNTWMIITSTIRLTKETSLRVPRLRLQGGVMTSSRAMATRPMSEVVLSCSSTTLSNGMWSIKARHHWKCVWNLGRQRGVLSFSDGWVHGGATTALAASEGQVVGFEQGALWHSGGQQVFRETCCWGVDECTVRNSFHCPEHVSHHHHHPRRDIHTVVHGDDFVAVSEDEQLDHF